jgi:hypothetical protein
VRGLGPEDAVLAGRHLEELHRFLLEQVLDERPSGGYPGSFNDGGYSECSGRLTASQERHVGAAFIVGFFRRYLGDETAIDPMWTGAAAPEAVAARSSHREADAIDRRLGVLRRCHARRRFRHVHQPPNFEGFEIVGFAADGPQAFERAAWLRPDVVLMDRRGLRPDSACQRPGDGLPRRDPQRCDHPSS